MKNQINIQPTAQESVKELLIEKGYDEKYGARPLRRTIQNHLEDKMAEEILDGHIKSGDKVKADRDGDEIVFSTILRKSKKDF